MFLPRRAGVEGITVYRLPLKTEAISGPLAWTADLVTNPVTIEEGQ
jgi:hypothetical protein